MQKLSIPFALCDKKGKLNVEYTINKSAISSGMDMFEGLGFDPNICLGYPVMYASVGFFEGEGYWMSMYYIQLIRLSLFKKFEDKEPIKVEICIDNPPEVRGKVPFCAGGSKPSFYDAPSFAKVMGEKVIFEANTYLVTPPSVKNGTTKRLCGFSWGYVEDNRDTHKRAIEILPIKVTDETPWRADILILNDTHPEWKFI